MYVVKFTLIHNARVVVKYALEVVQELSIDSKNDRSFSFISLHYM